MKIYKNENFKKVRVNNEDTILPNDWFIKKYKDFGGFKTGKDYKNFIGDKYSVYGSSEKAMPIKTNFPLYSNISFIIGRKGTINKPYRIDKPFWCVDTAMYFNLSSGNRDFLFYTCSMVDWMKYNKGGVLPSLTQSFINEFEFISPNVEEQKRIADVLSKQESIINKTKDLIEQLDKRNTFMLDELLSGRLRIKKEDGKMEFYKNPDDNWQTVLMNDISIRIPLGWTNNFLKGFLKIETGKKDANAGNKNKGKYSFFTCSRETLKTDEYSFDCEAILMAGNGSVGEVKYFNGKFDAYQRTYILSNYKYDLKYLYHYLNIYFRKDLNILGATIPYIKMGHIENFIIKYPEDEKEQSLILNSIESLIKEKEKYENLLIEEQKKFDFLLEELMSGRLRIEE